MVTRPFAPGTLALDAALGGSLPLARLLARVRESRARFDAIAAVVPAPLLEQMRPGPLDAEGWSLLVDNGAAAAKLRQLLPRMQETLKAGGWTAPEIRVRVLPRNT